MSWLWLSAITMLFWGAWGVLHKLATQRVSPETAWIMQGLGNLLVLVTFAIMLASGGKLEVNRLSEGWLAMVAGVLGALGTVAFLFAVSKGKASLVVTVTALYPIVTILLSVLILRENISTRQLAGIALALLSMYLLAGK